MSISVEQKWLHEELNEAQRDAVLASEGPVLILAGAGSGKTRVLIYRIAYILANGLAEPREILAMTFTNKAAGEMRERVSRIIPGQMSGMWIGTFHSLYARLLRREGERLGYSANFTIYDENDQIALLKSICVELKIPAQEFSPRRLLHQISLAKNALQSPEQAAAAADTALEQTVARVYGVFQRRLREANAMDFDDLLIKPIELFQQFPLVKEYYQDRFHYILVDEYQDTNRAQYVSLNLFAGKHKNICVVGDDDQSIYRWRGAELRNILDFSADYPDCRKYRLEQNYRSVQNILSAAHSVVVNNRQRHDKKLWTDKADGDLVMITECSDEREEGRLILDRISREFRENDRRFYDFAVLYRTNAQSRVLEEALRAEGIPYVIVGGVKFYERKEVKDVLAYLRVLCNPNDGLNLKRIINTPVRGIGDATVAKIESWAREHGLALHQALSRAAEVPGLGKRAVASINRFVSLLKKYQALQSELSLQELSSTLIDEIGLLQQYKEEGTPESLSRADNVRELLLAVAEFTAMAGPDAGLEHFLQHVSLTTDIDVWDDRSNAVTLMTLHSAKGLEFPVVFITGLEEGLFPLSRSIIEPASLEEERRLF